MYTDDVFTRLLPGESLVRNVLSAAEEYGLPRLRSICQSAIEGEGRALQLHPEEVTASGVRSRVGKDFGELFFFFFLFLFLFVVVFSSLSIY